MKVSVILPVFNGHQLLQSTLDSVLSQTHRHLEVIAIDDGSTDGSLDVLKAYAGDISIVSQPNAGVCSARNKGVDLATGELIAFVDQDDLWYAHKLERQIDRFVSTRNTPFVYSDFDLIDSRGRVTSLCALAKMKAHWMRPFIGGHLHPYPSTVLLQRSLFLDAGGFDTRFRENTHEDVDLWVRLYDRTCFQFIPEALVQYRRDHRHHRRKRRSTQVEFANYLHLYNKLEGRFQGDPSKKQALDRLLSVVRAYQGKELASQGRFKEARGHFREACRLCPTNKRHRRRYIRTFAPTVLRRILFSQSPL